MQFRVVEISDSGRHVSKDRGFLVIQNGKEELGRIPLDDIGVLLFSNFGCSLSTNAANALLERKSIAIFCGDNFHPSGILWPMEGHHLQSGRFLAQIRSSAPLRKRLWQKIIQLKIMNQGFVLKHFTHSDSGLSTLAERVRSGDVDNFEGQAARRYWPALFGKDFQRYPKGQSPNGLLNYGYAILRAATARSLVASGLHPALGIHHQNAENPFCLVDDLMEPFRPIADFVVKRLYLSGMREVTTEAKRELVKLLNINMRTKEENASLSQSLFRAAQSLAESFETGAAGLVLPDWTPVDCLEGD